MQDQAETVLTHPSDGVAEICLNRPERKNAITGPLGLALAECLQAAAADDEVRVVVLRGAGGAFCSGLDLDAFNADPAPAWREDFQHIWRGAHRALFELGKPLIGCLERYAINGGAALALACDLLVVGEESYLQVGEARIGMAAPYNMAWLRLRHSEALAARLALVGARCYGPELKSWGVAHKVVAEQDVIKAGQALAADLAGYPAGGLARIKSALRAGAVEPSADAWFDRFTGEDPVGGNPRPQSMRGR